MQNAIPSSESLTIEFKSDRKRLPDSDLVEAIVCLANAEGGTLWLGVEDDGTPTGLHAEHQQLAGLAVRLEACNPHAPLQRGYALVSHADGTLLRGALDSQSGEEITVRFAHDALKARVTDTPNHPQGQLPL